jgi:hypothetical protein
MMMTHPMAPLAQTCFPPMMPAITSIRFWDIRPYLPKPPPQTLRACSCRTNPFARGLRATDHDAPHALPERL